MIKRISGPVVLVAGLSLAAFLTTGCEQPAEDPSESTSTNSVVQTNFAKANLKGVWNMDIKGSIRNVSGVMVIDQYGNVTGLTGPTSASGVSGSFSLGSDAVSVNGSMKYSASGVNGQPESHTILFQGSFANASQITGEDTHSWTPATSNGYDKGTFTLSK